VSHPYWQRGLGPFNMNESWVPGMVYGALAEWLPGQTILLNHHTGKQKHAEKGHLIDRGMESALGSQFWTALVPSVIRLERTGERTKLIHDKSQASERAENIPVYVDPETSTLCLWSQHKVEEARSRAKMWVEKARARLTNGVDWDAMSEEDQVKLMVDVSGKSPSTVRRAIKAARES